eukprot:scaffold5319_cov44-Attheya_sp.AAC.1
MARFGTARRITLQLHNRPYAWVAPSTPIRRNAAAKATHLELQRQPWWTAQTSLQLQPESRSRGAVGLWMATKAAATQSTTPTLIDEEEPYKLVIVESPSKSKTIAKFLNSWGSQRYVVDSCKGHVRDLPKSAAQCSIKTKILGIQVDDNYEPTYIILPEKIPVVRHLQQLARSPLCQGVVLATDEDREGEAMAWHLSQLLELETLERVRFNEITSSALQEAFREASTEVNHALVEAQETRRILDRLAGFTMSPVLWQKIAPGLSAGRVQSVGMAMIVERERERLTFCSANYWDLTSHLIGTNSTLPPIPAQLQSLNGVRVASSKDFNGTTGTLIKSDKQKQRVHHLTEESANELEMVLSNPQTKWT